MSATVMRILTVLLGLLVSAACLIAFFGMNADYQRALRTDATEGRVLSIDGSIVRYERHDPGSRWDDDGDGWVGPYTSEGISAADRAKLKPGASLVLRAGKPEQALHPPTKLLFAGVGAGLIFAFWSFVAPILERRTLRAAGNDSSKVIRYMLRKTRNSRLIISGILVACAAFIGFVAVVADDAGIGGRIFLALIALVSVLASLAVAATAWKVRSPKNAPVMRAIEQAPETIVWVYVYQVISRGISSYNVHVCTSDGTRHEFNLRQLEPDLLLTALRERLPHAVFGYDAEREKLWKASPKEFRARAP